MNKKNSHSENDFLDNLTSFSKRSQAQIITTVLIILLVLAAIVIVWQVISTTVQQGAQSIEGTAACVGTDLEITSLVAHSCTNTTSICQDNRTYCEAAQCDGEWGGGYATIRRGSGSADQNIGVRLLVDGSALDDDITNIDPLASEKVLIDNTTIDTDTGVKVEAAALITQEDGELIVCDVSAEKAFS